MIQILKMTPTLMIVPPDMAFGQDEQESGGEFVMSRQDPASPQNIENGVFPSRLSGLECYVQMHR